MYIYIYLISFVLINFSVHLKKMFILRFKELAFVYWNFYYLYFGAIWPFVTWLFISSMLFCSTNENRSNKYLLLLLLLLFIEIKLYSITFNNGKEELMWFIKSGLTINLLFGHEIRVT